MPVWTVEVLGFWDLGNFPVPNEAERKEISDLGREVSNWTQPTRN